MASTRAYTWHSFDTIWRVAARLLQPAGYSDVPTFVRFIQLSNPAIYDWRAVPAGKVIIIPYASS